MNAARILSSHIYDILKKNNIVDVEPFEKLISYTLYDIISGLQNRVTYEEEIQRIKTRKSHKLGIAFIDINGLKAINDNFGHEQGDMLIRRAAFLIISHFGNESCYRIGGDEFVVVVEGCDKDEFLESCRLFRETMWDRDIPLLSIGFSHTEICKTIENTIRDAEQAMYLDKQRFYRRFPTLKR